MYRTPYLNSFCFLLMIPLILLSRSFLAEKFNMKHFHRKGKNTAVFNFLYISPYRNRQIVRGNWNRFFCFLFNELMMPKRNKSKHMYIFQFLRCFLCTVNYHARFENYFMKPKMLNIEETSKSDKRHKCLKRNIYIYIYFSIFKALEIENDVHIKSKN